MKEVSTKTNPIIPIYFRMPSNKKNKEIRINPNTIRITWSIFPTLAFNTNTPIKLNDKLNIAVVGEFSCDFSHSQKINIIHSIQGLFERANWPVLLKNRMLIDPALQSPHPCSICLKLNSLK